VGNTEIQHQRHRACRPAFARYPERKPFPAENRKRKEKDISVAEKKQ
jgi:hypothetical protein